MNTYNINDENFINSDIYKSFIKENPVNDWNIYKTKEASNEIGLLAEFIESIIIIFYDGFTDTSGVIEKIVLSAPRLTSDNLDVPSKIVYDIKATYPNNLVDLKYQVNIYEDIFVIQNINIVPEASSGGL